MNPEGNGNWGFELKAMALGGRMLCEATSFAA